MQNSKEDIEKVFDDLQKYFMEEASKVFSDKVVTLAYAPRNVGAIVNPDGHAHISGSCGDTMEIFIKMKGKILENITFLTDGCGATLSCGSAITELGKGKTYSEAKSIGVLSLLRYLDDLPASHEHCALLAVNTLQKALKDLKPL